MPALTGVLTLKNPLKADKLTTKQGVGKASFSQVAIPKNKFVTPSRFLMAKKSSSQEKIDLLTFTNKVTNYNSQL